MVQQLQEEVKTFSGRRSLLVVAIIVGITLIATLFLPENVEDFGALSLIPAIFLIVYIFSTKRILEALTLASVVGFLMVSGTGALDNFSESVLGVMMDEDIAWLIIVCGLMGSIITLIERGGGAFAFGEWVAIRAKTRKSALMWTWLLGVIIFIDDYLNSMTVGACMSNLTDKHKVPREFLAYVVDSTAAPACVIVPVTTWAVFAGRLLEVNGWAPDGEGLKYFITTIPFNLYAWFALILVPLVILGIVPIFGPMKKAEQRVKDGGPLAPPGSEKIDIRAGADAMVIPDNPKIHNFMVPIAVLFGSTIYFDVDMQMGVLVTMAYLFVAYLAQNLMNAEEFTDVALQGLKNMILPLLLMVLAFLFAEMNEQIGFTEYVIVTTTRHITPQFAPVTFFFVLAATEFITGTNWGMYVIAFPIVIPIALAMGLHMPLAVSTVLSAGVFGSHICFYSDATVLTSAATGCNNFDHGFTQAPFGILAASVAAVGYVILGFIFA